ncbi:hypothetical protein [Yoonia sp.]|uniref:hypothetical protein n=1 Tax=Yoonia sp. TaxID=2212373 RepID=UPI00239E4130|nr:hypothetical protein [Yoonia sp.]MDE0849894.1 hypothetical protein [Yoonia sp.]
MKIVMLMIIAGGLAACGANGAPLQPSASTSLSVGSGGVSTGTNVGLSNGTFSVGLSQNTQRR